MSLNQYRHTELYQMKGSTPDEALLNACQGRSAVFKISNDSISINRSTLSTPSVCVKVRGNCRVSITNPLQELQIFFENPAYDFVTVEGAYIEHLSIHAPSALNCFQILNSFSSILFYEQWSVGAQILNYFMNFLPKVRSIRFVNTLGKVQELFTYGPSHLGFQNLSPGTIIPVPPYLQELSIVHDDTNLNDNPIRIRSPSNTAVIENLVILGDPTTDYIQPYIILENVQIQRVVHQNNEAFIGYLEDLRDL